MANFDKFDRNWDTDFFLIKATVDKISMEENYLEKVCPNFMEENFDIKKSRKDPDKISLELYVNLAKLLFPNEKAFPNGNKFKAEVVKNKNVCTIDLKVDICDKNGLDKTIGLGSDFIGPSTSLAINAKVDDKCIKKSLKTTRSIGGHMVWPRYSTKCKRHTINQARGCGIYDRFDLTLFHLEKWYDNKPCLPRLKKVFCFNAEWLNLFVDFERFVNFFHLNSFVFEDNNENITGIRDLTCRWCDNQVLSDGTAYIPKAKEEYIIYMKSNEKAIKERNKAIEKSIKSCNKK
ncbi:MAG: hypothetical protein FWG65_09855 [Turicibacter sp.]|nr:hypothetical protein [Turicibacter sp.]